MRISQHDSFDTVQEQMALRYNRTYTVNRRGLPVYIRDVSVELLRDEETGEYLEDEEPRIVLSTRTRNGNRRELSEDDVVWDVWPRHHVIYHHKWGGCVVWEKRPDRQIKKLPCDSSMRIVAGHYNVHPLMSDNGWFDIVEAMRSPQFHDVETAQAIMNEEGLRSFPISPNAYLTSEGYVYYHNMPIGTLAEAREHRLWKIIQKEAA